MTETRSRAQGLRKYQALTALSVPFPGVNKDKQTVLVQAGEEIELTEEQARHFMSLPTPAIRPAKDASEPMPRLTGRHLSGHIRRPPPPAPGSDGARPDPAGSSKIMVYRDPDIPEGNEPQPGSENSLPPDALDIVPGSPVMVEGGLTAGARR